MSRIFTASFTKKSRVKLVHIHFSDQQSALNKLDVLITVDKQLIYHESMGESSFARYVRFKRAGQSAKEREEAEPTPEESLQVALDCSCTEITVELIFGHTSNSLQAQKSKDPKQSLTPAAIVEFYGDTIEKEDKEAAEAKYLVDVEEY